MKKLLLLITFMGFASGLFAQVSKTVNLAKAGMLSTSLTSNELNTISNLTLTGTIDARDFKTMRDQMTKLEVINLSGVTIMAYTGTEGTSTGIQNYSTNNIPESAFIFCDNLTSITIPSSVTSIGQRAFESCSGLTIVKIPTSVTSIGDGAFYKCSGLKTVEIPTSVTSIGVRTFYACSNLTSVTIPTSVTSIGDYTLAGCSGLATIIIPSSVTSISRNTFSHCIGLINVTIPSSVTSIGDYAFVDCSALTSVVIPSSVTSIWTGAFDGCSGLTNITIPILVDTIREWAFEDCSGLTSITTQRIMPLDLSHNYNVFYNVNKSTCTLYVPVGSKSAYQAANQWKDFKNIVEKNFTGINPIMNDQKLTFYPNPSSGKVKLVFDQIPKEGTTITVTDIAGKSILKQFIQNQEEEIDLSGSVPGVYLIRANMKEFKVQKVILK